MLAESAIDHLTFPRAIVFGVIQLTLILSAVWIGTRQRREDFRFSRVIGLTLLCLSSWIPFALIAYLLWPLDFRTWPAPIFILLAVFSPLVTAFILGFTRRKKMIRR